MKEITRRDALKGLSRFMRDMYCWCDQDGRYTTDMVSVSRKTVKAMRRLVDAVLDADAHGTGVKVPDGNEDVFAALCEAHKG